MTKKQSNLAADEFHIFSVWAKKRKLLIFAWVILLLIALIVFADLSHDSGKARMGLNEKAIAQSYKTAESNVGQVGQPTAATTTTATNIKATVPDLRPDPSSPCGYDKCY
jgi:hypothetical protein